MGHRAAPQGIHQHAALSANGFGDQKAGGVIQADGRWMELNEFQIFHGCARLPGEGDAFATGLGWVGGVGVQMATTAAGQHHGAGFDPVKMGPIQHLHAATAPIAHQQLRHANAAAMQQSWPLLNTIPQHIHQGSPCAVLHMQHPPVAVGCFQGGGQTVLIPVEGHAQLFQALHAMGCLLHQQPHRIAIAKAGSSQNGVLRMAVGAVLLAGHRGDAPLGPAAGRTPSRVAVEQQHLELLRQIKAGHQASSPGTDHHHVPGT